jgi:hypothetical protein
VDRGCAFSFTRLDDGGGGEDRSDDGEEGRTLFGIGVMPEGERDRLAIGTARRWDEGEGRTECSRRV